MGTQKGPKIIEKIRHLRNVTAYFEVQNQNLKCDICYNSDLKGKKN